MVLLQRPQSNAASTMCFLIMAHFEFILQAAYIPGKQNIAADISRNSLVLFQSQIPKANSQPTRITLSWLCWEPNSLWTRKLHITPGTSQMLDRSPYLWSYWIPGIWVPQRCRPSDSSCKQLLNNHDQLWESQFGCWWITTNSNALFSSSETNW